MKILNDHSLQDLNTFKINVKAKYFAEIVSIQELLELLADNNFRNEKKFVLGGGSNILFTKNFNGLVIKNSIPGVKVIEENNDSVLIQAGAGVNWDDLVQFCVDKNYGGIENLSFIPGRVGAAPIQNIGAYGQELSDTFQLLEAVSINSRELKNFDKDDCRFAYRTSIFKEELKNEFILTSVKLKLHKNPAVKTDYGEIRQYLEKEKISSPTINDIRKIIILIRKSKLPDPIVIGNAGSFFKNPVVDKKRFEIIKAEHNDVAAFKVDENSVKIAAGWLIEKCGWKGKRVGTVGTYPKHSLIIVNHDDATGAEVFEFAMRIKEEVESKFGIILEEEVNII
jgi:UDP-N-acetylmuramate dehydrogenase